MLNDEAKMMILCGSVNGTYEDLKNNMRKVNVNTVHCHHLPEVAVGQGDLTLNASMVTLFLEIVVGFGDEIGRASKCTCGKIYYNLR